MTKKKCPHCSHVNEFGLFGVQVCQLCSRVMPRSRIPILIAVILILVGLGVALYFQRAAISQFFKKPAKESAELEKALAERQEVQSVLKQHPVNLMTKEELERQEEVVIQFKKYEGEGLAAYRKGEYESALDLFRTGIIIFEAAQMNGIITKDNSLLSPKVINNLYIHAALAAQELDQHEAVLSYAQKAIDVHQSYVSKTLLLTAYMNTNQHSKARALIADELKLNPGSVFWKRQRGVVEEAIAIKEEKKQVE